MVKISSKKSVVIHMDGKAERRNGEEAYNLALYSKDWINYIVMYTVHGKKEPPSYEGGKPIQLTLNNYRVQLLGGTDPEQKT